MMPRRKGWTKPSFLLSTQLTAHTDVSKHAANIPEEVAKVESLEDEPTAYTQPPDCTNHRAEVPASPDALPDDTRSERAACFGPGTLLRLHQVGTVAGVPCPVEAVSLYDRVLVEGRKWATVTQIFRIAYTGELARFGTSTTVTPCHPVKASGSADGQQWSWAGDCTTSRTHSPDGCVYNFVLDLDAPLVTHEGYTTSTMGWFLPRHTALDETPRRAGSGTGLPSYIRSATPRTHEIWEHGWIRMLANAVSHTEALTGEYWIDASRMLEDTERGCRLDTGRMDCDGVPEREKMQPAPLTWPSLTYAKPPGPSTWADALRPDRRASRVQQLVELDKAIRRGYAQLAHKQTQLAQEATKETKLRVEINSEHDSSWTRGRLTTAQEPIAGSVFGATAQKVSQEQAACFECHVNNTQTTAKTTSAYERTAAEVEASTTQSLVIIDEALHKAYAHLAAAQQSLGPRHESSRECKDMAQTRGTLLEVGPTSRWGACPVLQYEPVSLMPRFNVKAQECEKKSVAAPKPEWGACETTQDGPISTYGPGICHEGYGTSWPATMRAAASAARASSTAASAEYALPEAQGALDHVWGEQQENEARYDQVPALSVLTDLAIAMEFDLRRLCEELNVSYPYGLKGPGPLFTKLASTLLDGTHRLSNESSNLDGLAQINHVQSRIFQMAHELIMGLQKARDAEGYSYLSQGDLQRCLTGPVASKLANDAFIILTCIQTFQQTFQPSPPTFTPRYTPAQLGGASDKVAMMMQTLARDFQMSWGDRGYDWEVGTPSAGKTAKAATTPVLAIPADPGHGSPGRTELVKGGHLGEKGCGDPRGVKGSSDPDNTPVATSARASAQKLPEGLPAGRGAPPNATVPRKASWAMPSRYLDGNCAATGPEDEVGLPTEALAYSREIQGTRPWTSGERVLASRSEAGVHKLGFLLTTSDKDSRMPSPGDWVTLESKELAHALTAHEAAAASTASTHWITADLLRLSRYLAMGAEARSRNGGLAQMASGRDEELWEVVERRSRHKHVPGQAIVGDRGAMRRQATVFTSRQADVQEPTTVGGLKESDRLRRRVQQAPGLQEVETESPDSPTPATPAHRDTFGEMVWKDALASASLAQTNRVRSRPVLAHTTDRVEGRPSRATHRDITRPAPELKIKSSRPRLKEKTTSTKTVKEKNHKPEAHGCSHGHLDPQAPEKPETRPVLNDQASFPVRKLALVYALDNSDSLAFGKPAKPTCPRFPDASHLTFHEAALSNTWLSSNRATLDQIHATGYFWRLQQLRERNFVPDATAEDIRTGELLSDLQCYTHQELQEAWLRLAQREKGGAPASRTTQSQRNTTRHSEWPPQALDDDMRAQQAFAAAPSDTACPSDVAARPNCLAAVTALIVPMGGAQQMGAAVAPSDVVAPTDAAAPPDVAARADCLAGVVAQAVPIGGAQPTCAKVAPSDAHPMSIDPNQHWPPDLSEQPPPLSSRGGPP